MNKHTGLIVGGILILVIAVFAFNAGDDRNEMMKSEAAQPAATANKEVMIPEKEMMKKEVGAIMDDAKPMMKAGSYEDYASTKLAMAATGDVVLFFHASWCPSCRGLSADIEKNMVSIPEGLTILKVNYDNAMGLKEKYGVTYQHTLVQVAADGTLIKKWSGSPSLSSLVSQVN